MKDIHLILLGPPFYPFEGFKLHHELDEYCSPKAESCEHGGQTPLRIYASTLEEAKNTKHNSASQGDLDTQPGENIRVIQRKTKGGHPTSRSRKDHHKGRGMIGETKTRGLGSQFLYLSPDEQRPDLPGETEPDNK